MTTSTLVKRRLVAGSRGREGRISGERQEQLEEYKQKVLSNLRRWLVEDDRPFPAGSDHKITVEEIRLARTDTGDKVIIFFREASRPGCLFGFGTFAVMPKDSSGVPHDPKYAETRASIVLANFEERLLAEGYGLPEECESGTVTWIQPEERADATQTVPDRPKPQCVIRNGRSSAKTKS